MTSPQQPLHTPYADETALDWLLNNNNNQHGIPIPSIYDRACAWFSQLQLQQGAKYNGTGISFVDEVFRNGSLKGENMNVDVDASNVFLEVSGNSQTGKSSLIMQLAASYLLATDDFYGGGQQNSNEGFGSSFYEKAYYGMQGGSKSIAPQVILLDLEYGLSIEQLAIIVRAHVLRSEKTIDDTSVDRNQGEGHDKEMKCIEDRIVRLLGRIHVAHPRDNSDLVSVLEVIRFSSTSANQLGYQGSKRVAPNLLLIDSIDAFDHRNRMLESLHVMTTNGSCVQNSSGLSGVNDFRRQLSRLRNVCNVAVIVTKCNVNKAKQQYSKNESVTHRIRLEQAKEGTQEYNTGYRFVAVIGDEGKQQIIPYSISSYGVFG